MGSPTEDDRDELLLSCRYGDLEDIQQFVKQFGQDAVAQVTDDNGSTVLHMAAGNGHEGKRKFEDVSELSSVEMKSDICKMLLRCPRLPLFYCPRVATLSTE